MALPVLQRLNQPTIQAPVGHQFGALSHHLREQSIGALLNVDHIVEVTNQLPAGSLQATLLPNSPQLLNPRTYELPSECEALFRGCVGDRDFEHRPSIEVDGKLLAKCGL